MGKNNLHFDFLKDRPKQHPDRFVETRRRIKSIVPTSGVVFWEGPSEIDGKAIVVVCNGFNTLSQNRKTGPMIQVYILVQEVDPWEAIAEGKDDSICGDCILRPQKPGGGGRGCYVQIYPWVTTVWHTYQRGGYTPIFDLEDIGDPFEDRHVRVGAYGDPAAVPTHVWKEMLKNVAGYTMYTSLWRTCDPKLKKLAMASTHSSKETTLAKQKGWRTFRTRLLSERMRKSEIVCPASLEVEKKVQCVDCCLCNGRKVKDKRKDIAIVAHGNGGRWYLAARCALNARSQGRFAIAD